jgi:rod shape-determining protein MreC
VALIDVAEENARLRNELRQARTIAELAAEEKAELIRLRRLLDIEVLYERPAFGARVIAKRFGPHAKLKTLTINKGYLDGAVVGTPVLTETGVVGSVLRAAPHAATILLLTDPGFHLAVISQDSRTPGILTGVAGEERRIEVAYVAQNAQISPGEMLITAGVDGGFPKGIPVGIVTQVTPGNEILFQQVHAQPMVDLERLEEVLLLRKEGIAPPLLARPLAVDPDSPPPPPDAGSDENPAIPGQNAEGNAMQNGSAPTGERQGQQTVFPSAPQSAPRPQAKKTASPQNRPSARIEAFQPQFLQTPLPGSQP